MAQAVWYTLQSVNKHQNFEIEHSVELHDTGFVEEAIDVLLILVNKLIPTNQLENIVEIWELDKKQLEDDLILWQQPFTDGFKEQERSKISSDDRAYFTTLCKIPYKSVYKSLDQRKEYIKANNLSKKAIQLGLDAGSVAIQELNTFMNGFIKKHVLKHLNNQELGQKYNKKKK
ncbi:hypothetical protein F8M41_025694 [Gigaspora margarita]|uniref:Uncharacterized protein n=1 Tax=Gigaspora margarita TaxID=4874 RepID=A0A8H4AZX7_GIGMA|nr:hypothetical protein F8M41_025694 [Gigaspora margarita]